jgi:hypothetical protein
MTYYLPFGPEIQLGQPFGARPGLSPNPAGGHNGDDWLTWIGVPVRAAGDGVVLFAGTFDTTYADNFGWNLNYGGGMIVLNMDGQFAPYFEYGHLSALLVREGQRVKAGQIIALTGNTDGGTNVSTGPHCHVGCLPWNYNLNSNTYGRVNPRIYMTKHWVEPVHTQAIEIKPKEWDEMASKEEIKAALREVVLEQPVLDAIALTILKRECYLIDPSGKTSEVVGTTTLARKINWMAYNDNNILRSIHAVGESLGVKLDHLVEQHPEDLPDLALQVPPLNIVEPNDG